MEITILLELILNKMLTNTYQHMAQPQLVLHFGQGAGSKLVLEVRDNELGFVTGGSRTSSFGQQLV